MLVADIGGTNARFAVAGSDGRLLGAPVVYSTGDFDGLVPAARAFLGGLSGEPPRRACIAVACPVVGDAVSLTNNTWSFSISTARAALGFEQLTVVNDFKALAAGVPGLGGDEWIKIGGGDARAGFPLSVIGPGTGFGVATVVPTDGGHVIVEGEGGHVGFAPGNPREIDILKILARRHGRVSMERLLSGNGLKSIYGALAEIDGIAAEPLGSSDIVARAKAGNCAACAGAVDQFCSTLGAFAGDVAMTMNSRGGVFIGGGIVPRIAGLLVNSPFRARFEAKGRISAFVRDIPAFLITADDVALRGAAALPRDGHDAQALKSSPQSR